MKTTRIKLLSSTAYWGFLVAEPIVEPVAELIAKEEQHGDARAVDYDRQRSHMWIAFIGALGCIFVSPAHHQCITQGTRSPSTRISAAALRFGTRYLRRSTCRASSASRFAHTFKCEVANPLINAAGHLKPLLPKRAPSALSVAERKRA